MAEQRGRIPDRTIEAELDRLRRDNAELRERLKAISLLRESDTRTINNLSKRAERAEAVVRSYNKLESVNLRRLRDAALKAWDYLRCRVEREAVGDEVYAELEAALAACEPGEEGEDAPPR